MADDKKQTNRGYQPAKSNLTTNSNPVKGGYQPEKGQLDPKNPPPGTGKPANKDG